MLYLYSDAGVEPARVDEVLRDRTHYNAMNEYWIGFRPARMGEVVLSER